MDNDVLLTRAQALMQRADRFKPALSIPDVKEAAAMLREATVLIEELANRLLSR